MIDCESTGLDSRARIIELAGISCDADWCPIASFQAMINPGLPLPLDIVRITGITNSMVSKAESAEVVLKKFFEWLPSGICVAHNAEFDLRLLSRESARVGITLPTLSFIDTLRIARELGETPNLKLATLVKHYRLPVSAGSHRAMADAEAVLAFLQYLHFKGSLVDLMELRCFEDETVKLDDAERR